MLPAGLAPEGYMGILNAAMYGTRRAGLLWGEKICSALCGEGFGRCRGNGQLYHHAEKNVTALVHGDDFLVEAQQQHFPWVDAVLERSFLTKKKAEIGPGGDQRGAECLPRIGDA